MRTQTYHLTALAASGNFINACLWRNLSPERFGVQIDYNEGYIGPGPEVYWVAYLILLTALAIVVLAVAELVTTKRRRWWLQLILAIATIIATLLPGLHWLF